ncbi:hypothetical protein P689_122245 [Candidatus Riesia pediculischaeffi PTSU]|uniref:Uncharacterized protein n=1 Tax=Candidatus Riesia pediculischaeffi PTSU TaxID=1401651 RepID=A0A0C1V7F1_9ENTR|nr:hypothetical protein P689_122245 [Candidatus Riesia pediculischaeffi PTSU]
MRRFNKSVERICVYDTFIDLFKFYGGAKKIFEGLSMKYIIYF